MMMCDVITANSMNSCGFLSGCVIGREGECLRSRHNFYRGGFGAALVNPKDIRTVYKGS